MGCRQTLQTCLIHVGEWSRTGAALQARRHCRPALQLAALEGRQAHAASFKLPTWLTHMTSTMQQLLHLHQGICLPSLPVATAQPFL